MTDEKRVSVLYGAVVMAAFVLLIRLYSLSMPENNKALSVLDGQYTGSIEICERSGFIYDRNMNLLSHDKIGFLAFVNPAECDNPIEYARLISQKAKVGKTEDIRKKIIEGIPFTITLEKCDVSDISNLKGVYVYELFEENKNTAVHFLGYNNRDGQGMCGLRGEYSELLGRTLRKKVSATFETNAKKASMSECDIKDTGYGKADGIVTTIDKGLQIFCDNMGNKIKSGAIVISDMTNGEILAMSSFPEYNPDDLESVLNSDKGELLNRCLLSFTPGSVFKILIAAAAIETNYKLYDLEYECTGEITVGENVFRCHNRTGHGTQNMSEAFANSCNTYFINLGIRTELGSIVKIAKRFGLDEKSEAGFMTESKNLFIDKDNSSKGYLAGVSFGQADLCISPVDMTKIMMGVSTGYLQPLSVVKGMAENGKIQYEIKHQRERILRRNTCEKLLLMMEKCVTEGTGRAAMTEDAAIGGKTATAQTGRFNGDGVEYVHKWFCGVYPLEEPRYSVCILCDFSTENSLSPAVVFSDICTYMIENGF